LRVETDIIKNARDLGAVLDHEKPLLRRKAGADI
jgi:hypothetical protein